jgi:hypothetical protein
MKKFEITYGSHWQKGRKQFSMRIIIYISLLIYDKKLSNESDEKAVLLPHIKVSMLSFFSGDAFDSHVRLKA